MNHSSHWAVLKCNPAEQSVEDALEQWFFTSSPAEEKRGDIACVSSFVDHVRCVAMPDAECYVDPMSLFPRSDAFILFYRAREAFHELYVLGGVTYEVLRNALHGVVLESDLQRPEARLRGFLVASGGEGEGEDGDDTKDETQFYFPCRFTQEEDRTHQIANMALSTDRESFHQYVEWILRGGGGARSHNRTPAQERGASYLCALLGAQIEFSYSVPHSVHDSRRRRRRFDLRRLEAEYELFMGRMKRLSGGGEQLLCHLFKFNNLQQYMDERVCFASARDAQMFPATELFLRVPVDEAPPGVGLPIHEGGYVHVPFLPDVMGAWLWNRYMMETQRNYTLWTREVHEEALARALHPLVTEWLREELLVLGAIMDKQRGGGGGGGGSGSERRMFGASTTNNAVEGGTDRLLPVNDPGVTFPDMEDLCKALPRCLSDLWISARRFPKNFERLRATQTMWQGGVSKDSIYRFYKELNDRYPSGERFETRYPVMASLRARYDKTTCGNLVSNVVNQKVDHLTCPYVKAHDAEFVKRSELREVTRSCRQMCQNHYGPGPHHWIHAHLPVGGVEKEGPGTGDEKGDGKGGDGKGGEKEGPGTGDESSSSSSSSDEDEEEADRKWRKRFCR
jgi:hypothetical protein